MILRPFLCLCLLIGWAAGARAACTIAGTAPLTFAPASSYDVREANVARISGSAGFSCNGSVITVLSSNYARASATSANGFTLRSASGGALPYRLSADSGGTYSLSGGATIDYFDPTLISLLGVLSANAMTTPIYAALAASPNLAAGTYTDTVTIRWAYQVCHGVNAANVCILAETGSGTTTIAITLVVGTDCRISAPNLAFGSAPLASGFAPVTQAVAVDCTLGAAFTVAFSSGQAGNARPWRAMKSSAGDVLQYNIYRADGTTIWDETTPLAGSQPGTGATTPGLLQTYVARVNPAQTSPPAGSYSDTVSVIVAF